MACGIPASLSNRAASPVTVVLPTPTGPVTSRTGTGAVTRSGTVIQSFVIDLPDQLSLWFPAGDEPLHTSHPGDAAITPDLVRVVIQLAAVGTPVGEEHDPGIEQLRAAEHALDGLLAPADEHGASLRVPGGYGSPVVS